VKDSRKGESLWFEWDGEGFDLSSDESLVFYTHEHVDVEHEVVKRALASTIQRDGIVHSLSQGFSLIDSGSITQGFAGHIGGSHDLAVCDETGLTYYGDTVDETMPITYVEVKIP
jgi:hypothetical protein